MVHNSPRAVKISQECLSGHVIDVLPFEAIINFTLTLQKGKGQPENHDNARNFRQSIIF